jgi:hypothetical protein
MIYAERLETVLRTENGHHNQEMMELKMELEATINSRRMIQQHMQDIEQKMGILLLDNNKLKVSFV